MRGGISGADLGIAFLGLFGAAASTALLVMADDTLTAITLLLAMILNSFLAGRAGASVLNAIHRNRP